MLFTVILLPSVSQPLSSSGLPDPTSIERQKSAYSRGLDDQLKPSNSAWAICMKHRPYAPQPRARLRHGTEVLAQQLKQQSDNLFAAGISQHSAPASLNFPSHSSFTQMGDQRKRQYALQAEADVSVAHARPAVSFLQVDQEIKQRVVGLLAKIL